MGYGGKIASRSGDIRRFNFTGNGSNTAFDLGFTPATQNQLIVTINGVTQHYDAFSVSGSVVTFTGTPASGDAIQVTAVVDAIGVSGIPDGAIANVSSLKVTTTPVLIGNAVGTFTGPLIQAASNANSWIQINAQNLNNGNNASTDMVLARSDGNDTAGFIDVGINSNTYAQAAYSIMTPNSGYMFTNGGDLVLGTQTAHNVLFHTGNTTSASERMRITSTGLVAIGTSNTTGTNFKVRNGPGGTDVNDNVAAIISGDNATYNYGILNVKNAGNRGNRGNGSGSTLLQCDFNDGTAFKIDKSGYVTKPYQPAFFVRDGTGTSMADPRIWSTVVYDDLGGYNNTTGNFTVPAGFPTGYWIIMFHTGILNPAGVAAYVKKNGATFAAYDMGTSSGWWQHSGSLIMKLAASDYVSVGTSGSAASFDNGTWSSFSGYFLG